MERPRGHREGCQCPVCRNYDARQAEAQRITEEETNMVENDELEMNEVEEDEGEDEDNYQPRPEWAEQTRNQQPIFVDTGRGQIVEVQAGSPFVPTLERIADEHNYGGYYRIHLNGHEVVNPEDSPATIELGMRIAITSYDKVG